MADVAPLYRSMFNDGPPIYYDDKFRNVLEDHLEYLKNAARSYPTAIEPVDAYKFEYDFFGLLTKLQIKVHLHWLTMRLNDMHSPTEFRADRLSILLPVEAEVEKLRSTFTTLHRIG